MWPVPVCAGRTVSPKASLLWKVGELHTLVVALTAATGPFLLAAHSTLLSVQGCSPCQDPTPCHCHSCPSSPSPIPGDAPKITGTMVFTQLKPLLPVFPTTVRTTWCGGKRRKPILYNPYYLLRKVAPNEWKALS